MLKQEENCWIYTEPSSKNRPASVSALNIGRKEVVIHPLSEEGDRCPVFIQIHTNHSLRATSTTLMFKGGVPEKLIQERTGHRSLKVYASMKTHFS